MAEPALSASDVVIADGRAPVSLALGAGEIVGLAGLDGHGQERFLETLAGLARPRSGAVLRHRQCSRSPVDSLRSAVAAGVVYLPRDRRTTGIFPTQSVLDNFAISSVARDRGPLGLIDWRRRRARYERFRSMLSIGAPRPEAPITTLSGGNQQKVLLARALALDPAVLLLNDPTRGVDVATRQVLYDVFRGLAADGMALVILSTEIEEVLLLAGRILVFRDGHAAAELGGAGMTAEAVIAAMFGRAA